MEISREEFLAASEEHGISPEQSEKIWETLGNQKGTKSHSFLNTLYYFGAMVVISALTWLMGIGWLWFGGFGIFLICLVYMCGLFYAARRIWKNPEFRIPAGLLATVAVCLAPLAIYGLEMGFGIWQDGEYPGSYQDFFDRVKGSWIFMEIGTILVGLMALRYFPFPFLTAPIFVAAWFLTMDIVPLLFGEEPSIQQRAWISLVFGLILLSIGFIIDRYKLSDYSFWSYLFGTLSFWGGLGCLVWDKGEGIYFLYFLINLGLIFLAVLVQRRVLLIFGAIGAFSYLAHLSFEIFKDSIAFPFVLSLVGLAIIYLGISAQRHWKEIEQAVRSALPSSVRNFFEF